MLPGQMQTRRQLAIVGTAQRARVLPRDAHGVASVLRKPGVIDDERRHLRQLAIERLRQAGKHSRLVPGTHRHALLQPLAHRLDLAPVIDQPGRDWYDAFALPVEQQPGDVLAHRCPTLGSS